MNHRLTSYKDRRWGDLKLHTHVLWKGRRLGYAPYCGIALKLFSFTRFIRQFVSPKGR